MHMKMYMYFSITTIWLKLSDSSCIDEMTTTRYEMKLHFQTKSANSIINGQLLGSVRF